MQNLTKPTRAKDIERHWHLFDVKGKVLGRVSTDIAQKLMGKNKANFVKNLDCGDHIVVINAKHIKVTGKKETQKLYKRYSGYPSGLKQKSLGLLRQQNPKEIIRHSVFGMLPKNKLRSKLITRLYIFSDSYHTFEKKFNKINI